ncbi:hypothetical protein [Ureibacillus chungkukjangi]|uniref:Uncharacterized protein n=1 Tax=Ureibacillus chungkukjangi TaxID=1202712 RepID=A0A318TMP5_9BACL|nr:hypothetical protein [Ureibacillus chungkukjangi]PYF06141.1 hypothetical protein BJ095_112102 [Ureibacillus chungkukjangi]
MKAQNQKGASTTKIIAITIIILLLIGGAVTIFYDVADKSVTFSEEEISSATAIAQQELNLASTAAAYFTFDKRAAAIQSVGYGEPEIEKSTMTFEKHNESNVYVLLKLQPHESYEELSRVLIQIFDKENGAMITELDNVLTWKK